MRLIFSVWVILGVMFTAQMAFGKSGWEGPRYQYKPKRFYFSPHGSMNVTSAATTNAWGLANDNSGKWNFGARLGYWFWMPGKFSFALETGGSYRDYGFTQNQSTIPYIAIPATLRMRVGRGFFKINIYGSAEFNRLYAPMYSYSDPGAPGNTSFNLFLHKNDAITAMYGMGFLLGKGGFQLEIFSERIYQVDTFDQHFGRTIGASTLGAALHFLLF